MLCRRTCRAVEEEREEEARRNILKRRKLQEAEDASLDLARNLVQRDRETKKREEEASLSVAQKIVEEEKIEFEKRQGREQEMAKDSAEGKAFLFVEKVRCLVFPCLMLFDRGLLLLFLGSCKSRPGE